MHAAYLDAGEWIFWALTLAVAFLGGRARTASRRASCAFEHAAQIPELLRMLRIQTRALERSLVYAKHLSRMQVLIATSPDNLDAKIHHEQQSLLEDLEALGQ